MKAVGDRWGPAGGVANRTARGVRLCAAAERGRGRGPGGARGRGRGFTLVEGVVVLVIILVLASLAFFGASRAIRGARSGAEQQQLRSLKLAVEQFRQRFGFVPPLVDDAAPLAASEARVVLRGEDLLGADVTRVKRYLRGEVDPPQPSDAPGRAYRFSEASLPIYVLGVLDRRIDGQDGPGLTTPDREGGFSKTGARVDPLFDTARDSERVQRRGAGPETTVLLDRWKTPIRYYRWEPLFVGRGEARAGEVQRYNVPAVVGDPAVDNKLRTAEYAIVSAGPDRLINDADAADPVNRDNLVEVGP